MTKEHSLNGAPISVWEIICFVSLPKHCFFPFLTDDPYTSFFLPAAHHFKMHSPVSVSHFVFSVLSKVVSSVCSDTATHCCAFLYFWYVLDPKKTCTFIKPFPSLVSHIGRCSFLFFSTVKERDAFSRWNMLAQVSFKGNFSPINVFNILLCYITSQDTILLSDGQTKECLNSYPTIVELRMLLLPPAAIS